MRKADKSKRTFTSLVRMPYQDALAVALHTHDYHLEMAHKGIDPDFHIKQARRLKDWIVDQKDYIVDIEKDQLKL